MNAAADYVRSVARDYELTGEAAREREDPTACAHWMGLALALYQVANGLDLLTADEVAA